MRVALGAVDGDRDKPYDKALGVVLERWIVLVRVGCDDPDATLGLSRVPADRLSKNAQFARGLHPKVGKRGWPGRGLGLEARDQDTARDTGVGHKWLV